MWIGTNLQINFKNLFAVRSFPRADGSFLRAVRSFPRAYGSFLRAVGSFLFGVMRNLIGVGFISLI